MIRVIHSNRSFPAIAVVAALLFGAGTPLAARKGDTVTISAIAAPDYVRVLAADGKLVPETYTFTEGLYFGGDTVDRSLERMSFGDLTRALAVNLAAQEYYPSKEAAAANLLIRVFWGSTTAYEDPQFEQNLEAVNAALSGFQQQEEGSFVDLTGLQNTLAQQGGAQSGVEGAIARNATLLGYRRTLERLNHKTTLGPEELLLRTELNEDRYFVVLVAYDYQLIRREKKPKILWITRLSIRGPGNNFTEALPALAQAGAQAYGRNLDDLGRVKVRDLPAGEVILGELKVIGIEENPPEQKAEK